MMLMVGEKVISIHALREEGDEDEVGWHAGDGRFLSTPSARRATGAMGAAALRRGISIHALREEGDSRCAGMRSVSC